MWKTTRQTIKKNPKMLLGFIIPVVLGLGFAFPIYRAIILTLLGDYSRIDDVPNFQQVIRYFAIASPIIYILMGVLVMPPLYSYVYEAVTGEKKNVWTKEGFLKYSWRVVVKSFLAFFILFGVFIVLFLFFVVPSLGFALYTFGFTLWLVFWIISLTSVIAEEKFVDSLPNTFYVGKRYYFKLYITSTLTMIPAILFSTIFMIYFHSVGMNIADAVPALNINPVAALIIFIAIALGLSVYYVFAQAFIFTYSMHYYIQEREKMIEEDRLKELKEEAGEDN